MTSLEGVILAAGEGRRLRPVTDTIPKALAPVDGDITIMDIALRNLAAVGIDRVSIVTGYAAGAIEERVPAFEAAYGVSIALIYNDKASVWNNAYSLWLARDVFARGALVVNGDTVHPVSVEERMLAARGPDVMIALDDVKSLAEEEMKVILDDTGAVTRINKALDPAKVNGEYIGLTLIEARAAAEVADSLAATFERDTSLYYEDGLQEYADRGGRVDVCPIGIVEWVEVDNHDDLARARTIACRY